MAPEYGTLDDFDELLSRAHGSGIRIVTDLVLNHTSCEHPWFIESSAGRTGPKADWYVWADEPPNDWLSCFDGSAWTFAPGRGQYYYHYFMRQQPDLNWRCPAVKAAMWEVARFWLDRGVDGFRLDAVGTIFEDPRMRPHGTGATLAGLRESSGSAASAKERRRAGRAWEAAFRMQVDGPGTHELMKELRALVDSYPGDRLLVGEDEDVAYMGDGSDEIQLVFNFPLMRADGPLEPRRVAANQADRLSRLARLPRGGWPCNAFGNHDSPRSRGRFALRGGHGEIEAAALGGAGGSARELPAPVLAGQLARARCTLALLLTLRGTPFLYNGEEIGMGDLEILDPNALRDTMAIWYLGAAVGERGMEAGEAAARAGRMSRDRCRTPLQWSSGPNAGFCPPGVEPWLPTNPDRLSGIDVADQEGDDASILSLVRRLIALRGSSPALSLGGHEALVPRFPALARGGDGLLAFVRRAPGQAVLVALNLSEGGARLPARLPRRPFRRRERVAAPLLVDGARAADGGYELGPFGILVAELAYL